MGVALTVMSRSAVAAPSHKAGVPANISPPTSLTETQHGQTLTEAHGSWTNSPTSFSYQWERCENLGKGCGNIAGATSETYTLTAADVGHTIVVQETATNGAGSSPPASCAPTAVVAAGPVTPAATTTSVQASASAAVTNQAVILIATVTSSSSVSEPSGTIAFKNGGTAIAGCASVSVGPTGQSVTVTCQASFAASTAQLTAVFTPNAASNVAGSSSPTYSLPVGRDSTSTPLDVSKTADVGSSTTYTAAVAPPLTRPGPIEPSGSVTFFANGQPIRSRLAQPLRNGGASCAVTYSAPAKDTITAQYGGDSNFTGSAAPAQSVRVVRVPSRVIGSTMEWTFYYTPTYMTETIVVIVQNTSEITPYTSA
jgi:Big-like domain-containing protein